mmetsp:Transcript_4668/g.14877  ORF Transcript_4668/g.14877 Transcript_4668/m.14877 type:complete len:234 (-) Transcript_4668:123-824(-)
MKGKDQLNMTYAREAAVSTVIQHQKIPARANWRLAGLIRDKLKCSKKHARDLASRAHTSEATELEGTLQGNDGTVLDILKKHAIALRSARLHILLSIKQMQLVLKTIGRGIAKVNSVDLHLVDEAVDEAEAYLADGNRFDEFEFTTTETEMDDERTGEKIAEIINYLQALKGKRPGEKFQVAEGDRGVVISVFDDDTALRTNQERLEFYMGRLQKAELPEIRSQNAPLPEYLC